MSNQKILSINRNVVPPGARGPGDFVGGEGGAATSSSHHMRIGARREPRSRFAELEGTAVAVLRELAKKNAGEKRGTRRRS